MNTLNRILSLFILTLTVCFQSPVFAGTIQQVKNSKVLIALEGTPAQVGEQFFALDESNKKTGLIEITAVKTDKAVAKILKGTAKPNDTILSKGSGASSVKTTEASEESSSKTFLRFDLRKIALNLKMSSDLISALQQDNNSPFPNKETVDMKGSNFGINATLGIPINKNLSFQGFAGYEMLKVTGTAQRNVCDGKTTRDCNVDITYITVGGLLRYNMIKSSTEYWIGGGVGFKQPISKKSTALTLENITLANSGIVAFGLDYHLSNKFFIPASFEYHKSFNESDTVPVISHMGVQIGFGKFF